MSKRSVRRKLKSTYKNLSVKLWGLIWNFLSGINIILYFTWIQKVLNQHKIISKKKFVEIILNNQGIWTMQILLWLHKETALLNQVIYHFPKWRVSDPLSFSQSTCMLSGADQKVLTWKDGYLKYLNMNYFTDSRNESTWNLRPCLKQVSMKCPGMIR